MAPTSSLPVPAHGAEFHVGYGPPFPSGLDGYYFLASPNGVYINTSTRSGLLDRNRRISIPQRGARAPMEGRLPYLSRPDGIRSRRSQLQKRFTAARICAFFFSKIMKKTNRGTPRANMAMPSTQIFC